MNEIVKYSSLEDKVIIVTGGASGIGVSIVEEFLNQGSKVFILDIQKQKSKNNSIFFKTDITKENDLKKFLIFLKKKKLKLMY